MAGNDRLSLEQTILYNGYVYVELFSQSKLNGINSNACIGICRDSRHKRRLTGGKVVINIKKRKFEMGRQPAMTKLGAKRIYLVRCRGGNIKHRAIRLDQGTFSWAGEGKRLLISLMT